MESLDNRFTSQVDFKFDKRYFCLLSDLLYEIIVVFVFLFLCVGYLSQYFSKYYNIYFSLFGIPYNYRKNKYTWSTDISVQITAMFYLKKNILYNELKNYQIDFKYFFFFFLFFFYK